ncbi:hypothetical protein JL720_7197 [Aureococcus anophagefferens]|nr:hypothetical protein JL720_7197 [Aureococcus anophagefferens]
MRARKRRRVALDGASSPRYAGESPTAAALRVDAYGAFAAALDAEFRACAASLAAAPAAAAAAYVAAPAHAEELRCAVVRCGFCDRLRPAAARGGGRASGLWDRRARALAPGGGRRRAAAGGGGAVAVVVRDADACDGPALADCAAAVAALQRAGLVLVARSAWRLPRRAGQDEGDSTSLQRAGAASPPPSLTSPLARRGGPRRGVRARRARARRGARRRPRGRARRWRRWRSGAAAELGGAAAAPGAGLEALRRRAAAARVAFAWADAALAAAEPRPAPRLETAAPLPGRAGGDAAAGRRAPRRAATRRAAAGGGPAVAALLERCRGGGRRARRAAPAKVSSSARRRPARRAAAVAAEAARLEAVAAAGRGLGGLPLADRCVAGGAGAPRRGRATLALRPDALPARRRTRTRSPSGSRSRPRT